MAKRTPVASPVTESPASNDPRRQALQVALGTIEKQFGKGAIMTMGGEIHKMPSISSGCLSLDIALGIGGFPRGRIIEIYGPESSGKTTLAISVVAQAQKAGGLAAYIDAEHAFDPEYARNLGVNLDELMMSQPDNGEQALEITETLVRSNAVDLVVIDSVAALVPRAEIEGEMGDSMMGVQARLMSQALRKLTGAISKSKTMVIFINQIRMKIGVMFGNPETTTGGNALKFYASVRIDIRRSDQLKEGDKVIGNHTKVKVVKNKVAPPFRTAEFDIIYAEGISKEGDILDLGVLHGAVTKAGSWYQYGEEKIGQGREAAREFLKKHQDITEEIKQKILAKIEADKEVHEAPPINVNEPEPEEDNEE